jgi:hypothetical protein
MGIRSRTVDSENVPHLQDITADVENVAPMRKRRRIDNTAAGEYIHMYIKRTLSH